MFELHKPINLIKIHKIKLHKMTMKMNCLRLNCTVQTWRQSNSSRITLKALNDKMQVKMAFWILNGGLLVSFGFSSDFFVGLGMGSCPEFSAWFLIGIGKTWLLHMTVWKSYKPFCFIVEHNTTKLLPAVNHHHYGDHCSHWNKLKLIKLTLNATYRDKEVAYPL